MAAQTEVTIKYLGPKGDGVGQTTRGRIYVEGGLPGDVLRVRPWRAEDDIVRGEIQGIITPSPERIKPPCKHYDQCGGCTLQHASPDFYRHWKQGIVYDALEKQGLRPRKVLEPVFLDGGKRRRATFACVKRGDRITMGYYKRRSDHITDIDTCLVVDPAILKLRDRLKTLLLPVLKDGRPTDVFIQYAGGVYDMVITGGIGKKGEPDLQMREALATLAREGKIARIGWRGRERDPIEVMIESEAPTITFGEMRVPLPPAAFLQPTPEGEKALVDGVMALMPERKGHYADLFSGCGTFAGSMLARGSVDAYESVDPAIKSMVKAKGALPLKAFKRDLFKNPLRRDEANRYDAIVFDPPRAGAREQCAELAKCRVPLLIAVSCNPATFARDARVLCDGGYRLDTVKVVDQFTWSHHVELVASFTRK
ncbi:MAG: class I SAM-dependent RNA methyltransferase [Alphaproteobacteria bacterium]|nr:class I SAM-dependent RNA methyltransferase [Alphaproteobacteria bacterium]